MLDRKSVVPALRLDFDFGPSTSAGDSWAFYVRDKFEVGERIAIEGGLRLETQAGASDVGADTVDTFTISPRLSGAYDVTGDGKTLIVGSYGRFYQSIIQDFSDQFAAVPQQTNYDAFVWNGSEYVFLTRVEAGASTFAPNTELDPTYLDEVTIGYQRQIGQTVGAGVRYIYRTWGNFIDDVWTFEDGSPIRRVMNYDEAERSYRGLEFTLDKRFSNNWYAAGSYTWAKTEGNHFGTLFTNLGDFLDADCSLADPAVGVIPCSQVTEGNQFGGPAADRPHSLKLAGAYSRGFGPVNLTMGAVYDAISKAAFTKSRTASVLIPGTTSASGQTRTYFYEARGSDRVSGLSDQLDTSFEATFRPVTYQGRAVEVGLKAEIFNIFNSEEKVTAGSTTWCDSTATAACNTARTNYGKATARGNFLAPRTYRFTAIFRF